MMKILKYDKPEQLELLKKRSIKVSVTSPELKKFTNEMKGVLKGQHSLALAAPQVGLLLRVFVFNTTEPEIECPDEVIVNPEIIEATGKIKFEENCLSFPGRWVKTKRKSWVKNALPGH